MLETLTLITLLTLYMVFFRPGKTPPLNNPLIVNRDGKYSALLAPMLNLAQPLLEIASEHLEEQDRQNGNTDPLYFMVQDKEVRAHGKDFYLLAATLRGGVLYFQATVPRDTESHLATIRAFSDPVLAHCPSELPHSETAQAAISAALQAAAHRRGATLTQLDNKA